MISFEDLKKNYSAAKTQEARGEILQRMLERAMIDDHYKWLEKNSFISRIKSRAKAERKRIAGEVDPKPV